MGLISNGTTLLDAGALDSGVAVGRLTLIKTLTASNSANLSFVHGASNVVLDGTYDNYLFKFLNIHPVSTNRIFSVNFRDGGSNFDSPKTSTSYRSLHGEDGNNGALAYTGNDDLSNATGEQSLANGVGAGNDEGLSGELLFYAPSNTTFVKHFKATVNFYEDDNVTANHFTAGFANTATAIDGVRFQMSSGNISTGVIKLYGIGE